MALSYKELQANKKQKQLELAKKLTVPKKFNYDDESKNYWRLTRDAADNGSAIIRFLAAPMGEDDEFVLKLGYNFKIKGEDGKYKYYIQNSPITIGKPDPMNQYNKIFYDMGEEGKKIIQADGRGMKKNYISNIYIVKDSANPENEGKVFLFSYGSAIYNKLLEVQAEREVMSEDGETTTKPPFNPFCLEEGANFMLKAKRDLTKNQIVYEDSHFFSEKPLFRLEDGASDDIKAEEVWKQCHSLQNEISEDKFRPYDSLYKSVCRVFGLASLPETVVENPDAAPAPVAAKSVEKQSEEIDNTIAAIVNKPTEQIGTSTPIAAATVAAPPSDDSWMNDFQDEFNLAESEADDTPF